jgi:phenylpropionate dioxygenase-like ring-hydroxylating dioxygenase large terminal subunit
VDEDEQMSVDLFTRDQWYAIGRHQDVPTRGERRTQLLDEDLVITFANDKPSVLGCDWQTDERRTLPSFGRYGHIWTTLGQNVRPLYEMPEFDEPGRRLVTAGAVTVRASGQRVVENFLDMAHFPFVHTGVLGEEAHSSVSNYTAEIRPDVDEVWATKCEFYQPRAAAAAMGGQMTHYMYRVPHPFSTILYKTCPTREGVWDLIGLFIQPRRQDLCDVHSFVLVFDETNSDEELLQFQQMIFLQDRSILENQVPSLLPLDPRRELPTRADASSIAYRRWLKAKGQTYGILPELSA